MHCIMRVRQPDTSHSDDRHGPAPCASMRWTWPFLLLVVACAGPSPSNPQTPPTPPQFPSNGIPRNGFDAETLTTAMTRATKELDCPIPRLTWRQIYAQGTRSEGEIPSSGSDALTIQISGCERRSTYTCVNFGHLLYETGHPNVCIREPDVGPTADPASVPN
jgi:hypothetical protein